jgi:hypothetical protein
MIYASLVPMLRFFRGSPFLSTLCIILFFCGPIVVAFRGELMTDPVSQFGDLLLSSLIPANFFVLFVFTFIIFSVRHLEHVISTKKCVTVSLLACEIDWLCRMLLCGLFKVIEMSSGPYTVVTTLLCLYCVFLPTVRAHLLPINEKVLLVGLLFATSLLNKLTVYFLVAIGFVVFLVSAPFCFPNRRTNRH